MHRDVKPENVLVTPDGRVKVADFGLARAVAETTLTGTGGLLLGTVAYLAPEQVERGVSDARSDVYAAGVMLYELLTGEPPFRGDTPIAVAYQRVGSAVPAPSSVVPGLPAEIDGLVAAATAIDPEARPADAGVLHTRLRAVRDALDLHSRVPAVPATAPAGDDAATTHVVGAAGRGSDTLVVSTGTGDTPVAAATAPPQRRRRRRWPLVIALVTVLSLLAAVGGWWLATGRYRSAPALYGLTKVAAEKRLHDAGLKPHWLPAVFSDTVATGHVAEQQPKPGHRLLGGATISLALSKGPDQRPVPDVDGKPVAEATAALKAARFVVGDQTGEWSETVGSGLVIRTDPPAGKVARGGTAVALVVSKGPPPVQVPDVRGKDVQDALAALIDAGFKTTTAEKYDDKVKKGRVITQDPLGGTAPKGSTVALTVSKGPQLFKVPNVVGKKVDDAKRILDAAGFASRVISLPGGPHKVLNQSPDGSSMRPRGTTVTLYVF